MIRECSASLGQKFRYNTAMRLLRMLLVAFLIVTPQILAQSASLREVQADGMKKLSLEQVVALSGLAKGAQVSKQSLQEAADALVRTGLFSKVSYNFSTKGDGVYVTIHVEENPRIPVYYDNFPWYVDSEMNDAIRKELPFYDGTLPESGAIVDRAAEILKTYLAGRGANLEIEHTVLAHPLLDTSVQEFKAAGMAPQIATVEFADKQLAESKIIQQHLPELRGKPYSRLTIDLFLAEQVRPVYQQLGNLQAKIGPAEVRLSGNPNQKLPEEIPVYIPSEPGPVYHLKEVHWNGASAVKAETLNAALGVKPGDVADGLLLMGGWDRAKDEFGHLGYLDAKLEPEAKYDAGTASVSYDVTVTEGKPYRYNEMTITGMSLAGERLILEAWPLKKGDVFDKKLFEALLARLETKRSTVFHDLPIHYDAVGHWLQANPNTGTVDVLLDFK